MKTTTLPDKPSELIRLALEDLEKVEADPRYVVTMGAWHIPLGEKCHVCMAGAVMAKSLDVPARSAMVLESFDDSICRKLSALNEFRSGHIQNAFRAMVILMPESMIGLFSPEERNKLAQWSDSDSMRDDWKFQMLNLAAWLEVEGL